MLDKAKQWLLRDPDETTRQELQTLIDTENKNELAQRFEQRLAFGTAGLRGKVGCGPNRMNRLVIQETSLGLGHYLLAQLENAKSKGVIIGYDGRLDSKRFAQDTAAMLASLGIRVYLTDTVSPTPVVAFGIKTLGTAAGIVVTASHNPPEYNGFKVYWENGSQIIPPHDSGIAKQIDIAATQPLPEFSYDDAVNNQLITLLSDDYYQQYIDAVMESKLLQAPVKAAPLTLAYTAMHGVGAPFAEAIIARSGLATLYSEPSQREPDGHFPTVNFPNPEEPGAMDRVIELATQKQADLACANDPDADRFAVAALLPDGNYRMLSGDQVGLLLADHLLRTQGQQALVLNTIVSSSMLGKIAAGYGAAYQQTLTGFKWLTNVAMQEQTAEKPFVFAYEEALGYATGTLVWDKDGLSALLAFTQLAAELKAASLTVWDRLTELYKQHGLYTTAQKSIALSDDTPDIGQWLRDNPISAIAGRNIEQIDDYKLGQTRLADGTVRSIDMPASDVLVYWLAGGARVIVRPSGTEPKIKCYYELSVAMENEDYWAAQTHADEMMAMLISEHQHELEQIS